MNDIPLPIFLVVVGGCTLFVSFLLVVRLGAAGRTPRQIAGYVAELWLTIVLACVLLNSMGRMLGSGQEGGATGELSAITKRFSVLTSAAKLWFAVGGIVVIGLTVDLIMRLNRAMRLE